MSHPTDMRTELCPCGQLFTYDAEDEGKRVLCDACRRAERAEYEAEQRRDAYRHDAYDRAGDR